MTFLENRGILSMYAMGMGADIKDAQGGSCLGVFCSSWID